MMSHIRFTLKTFIAALASTLFLSGNIMAQETPASSKSSAQTSYDVIHELMTAMTVNDADRIKAVFSDNAKQAYGQGRYKDGESFKSWLETDIIRVHGRVHDAVLSIDGDTVIVTGQYQNNNGYTSRANFLFEVKNGKVTSWRMRY